MDTGEKAVDLWVIDERTVPTQTIERLYDTLHIAEQVRADRYRRPADRARSIVARALLRRALSKRSPAVEPADWAIETTERGCPFVEGALAFNVTHTTGCVAVAVSDEVAVGVDAEWLLRSTDVVQVSARWFHPDEIADVLSGTDVERRRRFFTYWTLKEAYAKARGMGLAIGFRDIRFERRAPVQLWEAGQRVEGWTFRASSWGGEHIVSVAVEAPSMRVQHGEPGELLG